MNLEEKRKQMTEYKEYFEKHGPALMEKYDNVFFDWSNGKIGRKFREFNIKRVIKRTLGFTIIPLFLYTIWNGVDPIVSIIGSSILIAVTFVLVLVYEILTGKRVEYLDDN